MIDLAGELLAAEDRVAPPELPDPPPIRDLGKPNTQRLAVRTPPTRRQPLRLDAIDVDRPYGSRGDFEKVTVTLPSTVRALLLDESLRRKKRRAADWPIAAIVREALAAYLTRKGE
jgi:hypothetical protein